jgi:DNA repair protein RadA/Sms
MAKTKKIYYCQNCGSRFSQWMGQCTSCGEWNTIVEEVVSKQEAKKGIINKPEIKPLAFDEIKAGSEYRIPTGNRELDLVLGGGLVPGSVILIGGEPGIGKSTLMLQTALQTPFRILYVSGEESPSQIKMRAVRLGFEKNNIKILPETNTQKIFSVLKTENPDLLIIDSIQTLHTDYMESSPGSVSQIRETAAELIRYAKQSGTPVFIIGHITKEGVIAGPKILEHMVDTVLQFEGDRHHQYRILRSLKNRFGNTNEIGIFEMTAAGLQAVDSPSGILLRKHNENYSGTTAAVVVEGVRSFPVETQALVGPAVYGTPQRSVTGYDIKRINMILAVLEKRAGLRLGGKDVFLNITGGIKILDPGLDLAVAMAIYSSYQDEPVNTRYAFAGEIGLTGEIRPVSRIEQRIAEAAKNGFERIYISAHHKINPADFDIEVTGLKDVSGFEGI